MYFDIKQPRRSATLLAAVSQYENSTSCVMLLPICSSVVVVTDSASAPLFSLALLLSHQLKPPTAAVYLRAIHPLAEGGGGGCRGGTTCFPAEAPARPLLFHVVVPEKSVASPGHTRVEPHGVRARSLV